MSDLHNNIILRLEDAGRVLMALPMKGHTTALRTGHPEVVHDINEAYGWQNERPRIPVPSARRVSQMEEAFGWIRLLPDDQARLRRVVGLRMLVNPLNDRYIYCWRDVGRKLGIHHDTAQRWHRDAISAIAIRLL